ncbi:zinc finger HIT domain-containing protein 2 [Oryzias latipes]|uniref:Zinc finger, HIT-type containing 2 n=1 Tax=Oryzias latipes TaxID=8090 RepID=H2LI47_ORYLA|nr:zinc finger HIT domain-containing protein 2 [Oryzias latipes]XP_011482611.1 zinc finger HIT domain-containing protein 2 [Oryzias latipes]
MMMNSLIRRRLPPSVESLLTNIDPKEEWTDTESEPTTRDGILLPSRGSASNTEGFLSPAKICYGEAQNNTITACTFCKCKPSRYTCPRCNLQYCGLACYQSREHTSCSEEFYKESVLQELKKMGKTESEGRRRMQEILLGIQQKGEMTEGGMERVLKEEGIVKDNSDEEEEKIQVMELLSKLAQLQQSEEENSTEIEAILRKLEEIGGADPMSGDSDDDAEEKLDLTERLKGLDIDKLSEDELWDLLNSKERESFMGLMKNGRLWGLVPLWKPWWEDHEEEHKELVEMIQGEEGKLERETTTVTNLQGDNNKVKTSQEVEPARESTSKLKNKRRNKKETRQSEGSSARVPPVSAKIPKLSSLCANPSPLVCYSLVNTLYSYAFTLCRFNGDTDSLILEFCEMILALSEALHSSKVFSSVQEAIDCVQPLILGGGYLDKEDPLAPAMAVEAVAHIMTGKNKRDPTGYCLSALNQLRMILSNTRKTLSKEGDDAAKRQKFFQAIKKCEFYQAWVLENEHQIQRLAIELWSEHSKRESLRNCMDQAKAFVEENRKKEKGKKDDTELIEELN